MIAEDSRFISEIDDMLTLDGLVLLFERNRAPAHAAARVEADRQRRLTHSLVH